MVILVYNAMGKMKSQGLKVTDLAANLTNIEQSSLHQLRQHRAIRHRDQQDLGAHHKPPRRGPKGDRHEVADAGPWSHYLQYQAGQAMTDAANNPSGTAGVGAGLGVGLGAGGVGSAFGQAMMGGMSQGATKSCSNCGSIIR